MNRKTMRIASAGFVAAAALVLSPAGQAIAAPEQVAITVFATGNTVTVNIANLTTADIFCAAFGNTVGGVDPQLDTIDFSLGMGTGLSGGEFDFVTIHPGNTPFAFPNIPAGEYQVDWACSNGYTSDLNHEEWGTPVAISTQATTTPSFVTVTSAPPAPPRFGSS